MHNKIRPIILPTVDNQNSRMEFHCRYFSADMYKLIFITIVVIVIIFSSDIDNWIQRQTPQTHHDNTTVWKDSMKRFKMMLWNQSATKGSNMDSFHEKREEEFDDTDTKRNSSKYKNVLIMASTRTGSSFVGDIFNQHGESMFYLYEPLHHVRKSKNATGPPIEELHRDVIRALFQCDFSLLEKFIHPPPKNHITNALFRRESSLALNEKPVCTRHPCGPLNLTLASESCLSRQHHTIKTISLQKLDILQPLMDDPNMDFKIIQLIRDPRAIIASRMEAFSDYKMWKAWAQSGKVPEDNESVMDIKKYCTQIKFDAELGFSQTRWLNDRYKLVRYEDVTSQPLRKAEEMYNFTGIPFNSRVSKWISRNTQKTDHKIYSTQRNASEQADKWRKAFPFTLAQVVQKVCEPAMKLFGYKSVGNEKTLRDLSFSLTEEELFD